MILLNRGLYELDIEMNTNRFKIVAQFLAKGPAFASVSGSAVYVISGRWLADRSAADLIMTGTGAEFGVNAIRQLPNEEQRDLAAMVAHRLKGGFEINF